MKAITIRQPWASAIADGVKDIENRSWRLSEKFHGEWIAVHSACSPDRQGREYWPRHLKFPSSYGPLGAIIAMVKFGRPEQASRSPWYNRGSMGWPVIEVRKLSMPIPCKGSLGLWTVPAGIEAEIHMMSCRETKCAATPSASSGDRL